MKPRRTVLIAAATFLALLAMCDQVPAQLPKAPKAVTTPSAVLAQLAAESNLWVPCCEPGGPTKGLWGEAGHGADCRSWQEYYMSCRDGLSWLFARPSCSWHDPGSTSVWDHIGRWLPRWAAPSRGDGCGICEPAIITTGTVTFDN